MRSTWPELALAALSGAAGLLTTALLGFASRPLGWQLAGVGAAWGLGTGLLIMALCWWRRRRARKN